MDTLLPASALPAAAARGTPGPRRPPGPAPHLPDRARGRALLLALLTVVTGAAAQGAGLGPAREIVQQRQPDGSVLFTDQPRADLPVQRRWTVTPEDPALAAQRRAQALQEIEAIDARVERSLARDQARRVAEARLAEAAAERARLQAELLARQEQAAAAQAARNAPPVLLLPAPVRRLRPEGPPRLRPPQARPAPPAAQPGPPPPRRPGPPRPADRFSGVAGPGGGGGFGGSVAIG